MPIKKETSPISNEQQATSPTTEKLDERVRRSRETVLRVTAELLVERGVSGLRVDDVSRRSGVAKTTIYRHWKTRSDLVIAGCIHLSTQQKTPDSGRFEKDITALLLDLAHLLMTAKWPSVLPSIVDAAERDPDLAAIYSQLQASHVKPYVEIIERAKCNGEIPAKSDTAMIVAELVGPLFYRRWFSREALDEGFVKGIVESVMRAHAQVASRNISASN